MSTISNHHRTLTNGIGKCSVPMWCMGCPAGFCDAPAYGERPPSRQMFNYCAGRTQREDNRYDGYVPGLACLMHGGPSLKVFMDGDAWCAALPDFVNLQESPSGWGTTKADAITALHAELVA